MTGQCNFSVAPLVILISISDISYANPKHFVLLRLHQPLSSIGEKSGFRMSKNPTPEGPALETPGRGYPALPPEGARVELPLSC